MNNDRLWFRCVQGVMVSPLAPPENSIASRISQQRRNNWRCRCQALALSLSSATCSLAPISSCGRRHCRHGTIRDRARCNMSHRSSPASRWNRALRGTATAGRWLVVRCPVATSETRARGAPVAVAVAVREPRCPRLASDASGSVKSIRTAETVGRSLRLQT